MRSESHEPTADVYRQLQGVLEEALSLGTRAYDLKPDSRLLGALPELDSQAVLSVLMSIEERFGITIADDDVDAEVFATLRSLAKLVAHKTADQ